MAQTILTPAQKVLLGEISNYQPVAKRFYLTGGTALSEFYLHHRLSGDLDFFSENEFDTTFITIFFKKNKKKIGYETIDIQKRPNRFNYFIHFPNEVIKIDFAFYPYPRIRADLGKKTGLLRVDSIFDIATNKVFTLFQNPRLRDYADLFYIFQEEKDFSLNELIGYARNKFDLNVDPKILAKHFLDVLSLKEDGFPKRLKPFDKKEMEEFFISLAKSLEKEIFTD